MTALQHSSSWRAKRNKYGAKKTVVDGITFDSKAEAKRYSELKLLERAGEISHLERQPEFLCEVNGRKICTYKADFRYRTTKGSVVEDVKGMKPRDFTMRKKLVEALYPGTEIVVVQA